jgi:tripeptide aminopeptidase
MINTVVIGSEFVTMLPAADRPEHTEMYEGFIHVKDSNATVEEAKVILLFRDHDRN